jgi:hypothetical protein
MSTINSNEHDAEHGVRSEPDSKPRREPASKGVRLRLPDQPKRNSEVM